MSKLRAILLSQKEGLSARQIASNLGISDRTVRNYLKKLKINSHSIDELLSMDEYELEKQFFVGNFSVTDERFDYLKERLEQLSKEWAIRRKTHVTKELLWQEYCEDCKNNGTEPYQYTQFVYHFNKYVNVPEKTLTYIFKENKEAGKYLFVDYAGDTIGTIDPETGVVTDYQIFIAVYPYSNALFVMPIKSQCLEDYIYCLDCCVRKMGIPKIILCDNLKSAVIKASRYDPTINTVFEDFCSHYNIIPMAARPYTPREKSEVERYVQVTYNHIYAKLRKYSFFSYAELDNAIQKELKIFMQSRPKGTNMTREEIFIALEKPLCQNLNAKPFEVIRSKELRVENDSCVHPVFNSCRYSYSVPYKHIGKLVTFKYTMSLITIIDNKEVIAMHNRVMNKRTNIKEEHMPSYYGNYVNVSPEKYIQRAKETSCDKFTNLVEDIFNKTEIPETMYKKVDYLFHLQKITQHETFSKACEIALLLNRTTNTKFINNLIESKCAGYEALKNQVSFPSQDHENIRGKEYYQNIAESE